MDGDRLSASIPFYQSMDRRRNGVSRQLRPSTVSRTISQLLLRPSPEETNDLSHVIDHLPMGHLSFLPSPPTNVAAEMENRGRRQINRNFLNTSRRAMTLTFDHKDKLNPFLSHSSSTSARVPFAPAVTPAVHHQEKRLRIQLTGVTTRERDLIKAGFPTRAIKLAGPLSKTIPQSAGTK
ncbi:hypothetical protein JTE90_010670 [Oedothorax gibbosus]|uniref:Uncharacterized protein n=1 Tax=Oedothorax gibbosus TaxID=931172 RepID=A0AAV6UT94_9ARAC|nr:hypothetical protein JTE90_010670 [Oedothorax gibbosus]